MNERQSNSGSEVRPEGATKTYYAPQREGNSGEFVALGGRKKCTVLADKKELGAPGDRGIFVPLSR